MSAVDQGRVGELLGSDGAIQPLRLTRKGGLGAADVQARYQESVLRGNVYYLATGAAAPTAFTGAAAGTPLIGVFNPSGSGKALIFLLTSATPTAVPTVAGVIDPELWAGTSVLPTGTVTAPSNMATQQTTGSVAKGFVNTAMTSSTAINFVTGIGSFWWATAAAGAQMSNGIVELAGMLVATPGVLVALGVRTVPTSLTIDPFLMWEEVPYP
ncbi:hypothetical protein E6H33_11020 [Candidatus Bathyarchaeota archaeon]|nr:MAG: hypothetical protein E6H33_11020 [Candidatus Bathyarchaeota archaeon]